MEFLGLKIAAGILWTAMAAFIGNKWATVNSISDLENDYKTAVATLEALKTKLASEIAAAEAKVASLKSLV